VLRHLGPDHRVNDLQVEPLADAAIPNNHDRVASLDRRDDRVLAIFGVDRARQLPGVLVSLLCSFLCPSAVALQHETMV
jgi:hypothetical protein